MEPALKVIVSFARFIAGVVVPVTVWFTLLRQDVKAQAEKIERHEQQMTRMQESDGTFRDRINTQYGVVIRELGEIRGELKRLK